MLVLHIKHSVIFVIISSPGLYLSYLPTPYIFPWALAPMNYRTFSQCTGLLDVAVFSSVLFSAIRLCPLLPSLFFRNQLNNTSCEAFYDLGILGCPPPPYQLWSHSTLYLIAYLCVFSTEFLRAGSVSFLLES